MKPLMPTQNQRDYCKNDWEGCAKLPSQEPRVTGQFASRPERLDQILGQVIT